MFQTLKTWWKQRRCRHEFQAKARIQISVSQRLGMYRPPRCVHCCLKRPDWNDSYGQHVMHEMFRLNIPPTFSSAAPPWPQPVGLDRRWPWPW